MNQKITATILVLFLLLTTACAPQAAATATPPSAQAGQPGTLTVMAAASLTAAFQEIGKAFESQHAGVKVEFNFSGSQQLAQQIAQGAPADVFASANKAQMDAVVKTGQVDQNAPKVFVKNRLVVIYPKANPAKISKLQDLAKPGLKIDLAAKEVPVGQYALDFLAKASQDASFGAAYQAAVTKNVVSYEDNVKAVLTKVSLGEADAGIVYTTDAAAAPAGTVEQLAIPDAFNVIASYPIAVIKTSKAPDLAKAFVDLVLSPTGQDILKKYGFIAATN
jgi:molybdate transport system substrate-binding protein